MGYSSGRAGLSSGYDSTLAFYQGDNEFNALNSGSKSALKKLEARDLEGQRLSSRGLGR